MPAGNHAGGVGNFVLDGVALSFVSFIREVGDPLPQLLLDLR